MQRFVERGKLTGLPDARHLIAARWKEAACIGEDPELFFNEPTRSQYEPHLASASLLLPVLTCSSCQVRRDCLAAALDAPSFNVRPDEPQAIVRVMDVWAASTEFDRHQVKDLPPAEAVEALEATLADRVASRVAAWSEALEARLTGELRRHRSRREERIEAIARR